MPLKPGYSRQTFNANLRELLRSHERNSAIMAAASMARKSFFRRFPNGALPNWLAFPKGSRLANHYTSSGAPIIASVMRENPHIAKMTKEEIELTKYQHPPVRGFSRNPVNAKPNLHALERATALYEGFTGESPRALRKLTAPQPMQEGLAIGKVFGIMYSVDATGERFRHIFKQRAQPLLVVSPDGHQVILHGGAYTFTKRGFVDK